MTIPEQASELELTQSGEYEQSMLYLLPETKEDFEFWLSRLEREHDCVFESQSRDYHNALSVVVMNHPDEFVETVTELSAQKEEYKKITFYLTRDVKKEYNFWYALQKREYPELKEYRKRDLNMAFVLTGMKFEDEFIATLNYLTEQKESE